MPTYSSSAGVVFEVEELAREATAGRLPPTRLDLSGLHGPLSG